LPRKKESKSDWRIFTASVEPLQGESSKLDMDPNTKTDDLTDGQINNIRR
jgi:hypothetical protein